MLTILSEVVSGHPVYAPFVRRDETQRGWASGRKLQDGKLERSGTTRFSVSQSGLLAQRRDHVLDKLFQAGVSAVRHFRRP